MERALVHEIAGKMLLVLRRPAFDPTEHREEIGAVLRPFIGADERLFRHGVKRPNPPDRTRLIYYSPEMLFFLSRFGPDYRLPVHNHESWNCLMILSGSMHFRWYRRLDDRSVPGRSRVEIAEDRVVKAGEIGFVAPAPHDIHQLEILEENTWMLTVAPCMEPELREVHDPASGSYEVRALGPLPVNG